MTNLVDLSVKNKNLHGIIMINYVGQQMVCHLTVLSTLHIVSSEFILFSVNH